MVDKMQNFFSSTLFLLFIFSCFKKSLWYDFKVQDSYIGIYLFNTFLFKKISYNNIESIFLYDKSTYKDPSSNIFRVNKYENRMFKHPIWLIMKDTYLGNKFITLTPKDDIKFINQILRFAPYLKCTNYEKYI